MKTTNTRFAVAVHVLTYLAGVTDDRTVSSGEMASSANVSPVYVRRVLGPLREAGLVRSHRGVHGGWALRAEPERITLAQLWLLFQSDEPVIGVHGPDPACATGRRVQAGLVSINKSIEEAVGAVLGESTIYDMAADHEQNHFRDRGASRGPSRSHLT